MRIVIKHLTFIFLLAASAFAQSKQDLASGSLVLTHVTVIDTTGAPAKSDMAVVIVGDRIGAVARTDDLTLPRDAQVIDASGKYLIPGLWDMHVHVGNQEVFFPLFIANGVTGIRDMGNTVEDFEQLNRWRTQIRQGERLGPRIVLASPILDGPRLATLGFVPVNGEAEGRRAVSRFKSQGADFTKVLDLLSSDAYLAVADEAKKQNMPLVGHVPLSVGALKASKAGQQSIEHLFGVLEACSTKEEELSKDLVQFVTKPGVSDSQLVRLLWFVRPNQYLDTYSDKKAKALFNSFRENNTWQCPTLVLFEGWLKSEHPSSGTDPRLKYMSPGLTKEWDPKENLFSRELSAEDWDVVKRIQRRRMALLRPMHQEGVKFLAGTDTNGYNPHLYPGFSLHEELQLLVKAGLTPMQALQTATHNPAQYLGLRDSLGSIEKGKIADLVLLEANPLENIRNTQKIAAVVVNGKLIPKEELQKMMADVEVAVTRK